jgi:hypothetical protein
MSRAPQLVNIQGVQCLAVLGLITFEFELLFCIVSDIFSVLVYIAYYRRNNKWTVIPKEPQSHKSHR